MLKLISLILIICIVIFLIFYKKEYIFNKFQTKKNLSCPTFKDNGSSQLKEFKLKPVDYVRRIEIMIVDFLKEIGIDSKIIIGKTGVWIDSFNKQRKIAAIGVRVSGGITMHGFALNMDNNLGDFNSIIPCGLPESEATSLKTELKSDIDKSDIKSKLLNSFEKIFDCEVIVD